ncbi:PREDICTED: nuclear factor 7, ovary-like [Nanorana parkeri]|uniref:nuclear factor 7, ovary-like n=1 Tax=Nanorana parkeri TaxID=125878 RepID=UPI000854BEFF|nr:PREDICTED: nuclear factor 7, ovary-like [Nanorana parkeri]
MEKNSRQKQPVVLCTYCKPAVPAVKSCLQCEQSMCSKHLKQHNTTVDHVLVEPIRSFEDRKCSLHKEVLKYYCCRDNISVCASCSVTGSHKGHQVVLLNEASDKKKEKLKTIAKDLKFDSWKLEKRLEKLQNHRKDEKGKVAALNKRVRDLFKEIRDKVNALEMRVLAEILRQDDHISLTISDLIRQLELQKDKMSNAIARTKELLSASDPLSVIKEKVESSDIIKISDDIGDVREAGCLDEGIVSQMLHKGILQLNISFMDLKKMRQFGAIGNSHVLLDPNSAGNNVIISEDLTRASYAVEAIKRPDLPERFKCSQVLSRCQFTTGRHYWEVAVGEARKWLVGLAAASIERKKNGNESYFGCNNKSWGLSFNKQLSAGHDNMYVDVPTDGPIKSVGMYLDYEAGHLTFFQLSDPIKCLHTFAATFTEPLHAAFILNDNSSIRILN